MLCHGDLLCKLLFVKREGSTRETPNYGRRSKEGAMANGKIREVKMESLYRHLIIRQTSAHHTIASR